MEEFFVAPQWFTAGASTSQISFQDTCLHQRTGQLWPLYNSPVNQLSGRVSFILGWISIQIFFWHLLYFWSYFEVYAKANNVCSAMLSVIGAQRFLKCLYSLFSANNHNEAVWYIKHCYCRSLLISAPLLFSTGKKKNKNKQINSNLFLYFNLF